MSSIMDNPIIHLAEFQKQHDAAQKNEISHELAEAIQELIQKLRNNRPV